MISRRAVTTALCPLLVGRSPMRTRRTRWARLSDENIIQHASTPLERYRASVVAFSRRGLRRTMTRHGERRSTYSARLAELRCAVSLHLLTGAGGSWVRFDGERRLRWSLRCRHHRASDSVFADVRVVVWLSSNVHRVSVAVLHPDGTLHGSQSSRNASLAKQQLAVLP